MMYDVCVQRHTLLNGKAEKLQTQLTACKEDKRRLVTHHTHTHKMMVEQAQVCTYISYIIHIHIHASHITHTRTAYTNTHIYTHIHTYPHTHIHTYPHTHIHTYTHTHIHTYIHTHIHTYTHTHIHIYIHTHITGDACGDHTTQC